MSPLYEEMYEDLEMAYGLMVEAKYRPAAPSDGCWVITGTPNLVTESLAYAQRWAEEEEKGRFFIGRCRRENRVATVLAVEAARLLCARILDGTKDNRLALRVLKTAVTVVERETKPDNIEGRFGLESDLQRALRAHIEQLEPGLRIIDGGRERILETGRVDILAEDGNQTTVVIELKTAEADDHDVGQILRYMGELASSGKQVRGILVAGEFSRRARNAANQVNNLCLREYKYSFSFKPPLSK
jgi:endonuclease NucS-like protein